MPETCYHPSLEGAQHGAKSLTQFLDYARASGTTGAQPSNFMLEKGKRFKSPEEIKKQLGIEPELPPSLTGLDTKPETYENGPNDYPWFKDFLVKRFQK